MSRLVEELKKEHQAIVENLKEIKILGVTSDEGQRKLARVKKSLLAHLDKEDRKLYPRLEQEAQNNPELKKTLDFFAKDMEKISSSAMAFFEKYSNGGKGIQFASDFGTLVATLSQRIYKEEQIIYQKFNQIA